MKLCNDAITVYNRRVTPDKKKIYVPTTIRGIHWFGTQQVLVTNEGLIGAKQYTIRIPIEAVTSGKQFVMPKEYAKRMDYTNLFTLDEGDIIVHGISESTMKPDELQEAFDEVVTIISVTDNRTAPNAQHWKVVCK